MAQLHKVYTLGNALVHCLPCRPWFPDHSVQNTKDTCSTLTFDNQSLAWGDVSPCTSGAVCAGFAELLGAPAGEDVARRLDGVEYDT